MKIVLSFLGQYMIVLETGDDVFGDQDLLILTVKQIILVFV
jgi:hypothetical protein